MPFCEDRLSHLVSRWTTKNCVQKVIFSWLFFAVYVCVSNIFHVLNLNLVNSVERNRFETYMYLHPYIYKDLSKVHLPDEFTHFEQQRTNNMQSHFTYAHISFWQKSNSKPSKCKCLWMWNPPLAQQCVNKTCITDINIDIVFFYL